LGEIGIVIKYIIGFVHFQKSFGELPGRGWRATGGSRATGWRPPVLNVASFLYNRGVLVSMYLNVQKTEALTEYGYFYTFHMECRSDSDLPRIDRLGKYSDKARGPS